MALQWGVPTVQGTGHHQQAGRPRSRRTLPHHKRIRPSSQWARGVRKGVNPTDLVNSLRDQIKLTQSQPTWSIFYCEVASLKSNCRNGTKPPSPTRAAQSSGNARSSKRDLAWERVSPLRVWNKDNPHASRGRRNWFIQLL